MLLTSQFRNELETIVLRNECAVDVNTIYSTCRAFAALTKNGTVVAWGGSDHGGNTSSVQGQLVPSDVAIRWSARGGSFFRKLQCLQPAR